MSGFGGMVCTGRERTWLFDAWICSDLQCVKHGYQLRQKETREMSDKGIDLVDRNKYEQARAGCAKITEEALDQFEKQFENAKQSQQKDQPKGTGSPQVEGTPADRPRWDLVDRLREIAQGIGLYPAHALYTAADRLQALEMEKLAKPPRSLQELAAENVRLTGALNETRQGNATLCKDRAALRAKLDLFEQQMKQYQDSWYAEVGRVQQVHKELAQVKEALRVQSENHLPVVAQLGAAQRRIKELCVAIDFAQYKLGQVSNA